MALNGYTSATSVVQGDALDLHISSTPASDVTIEVRRVGLTDTSVFSASAAAPSLAIPADACEHGCRWPAAYTLNVPADWPSGLYRAELANTSGDTTTVDFVVAAKVRGGTSSILLSFAVNTAQAYNETNGKSLYAPTDATRARQVSFDRPGELTTRWEQAFVRWLAQNGYTVECCTSVDLHVIPDLLEAYQLLVSVGHDEYWSREMRDHVETFISWGGNVAFFGANTSYWQVRYEDANRTMVCYKNSQEDPLYGKQNYLVTDLWSSATVNRPENRMTGVSYRAGAGNWAPCNSPQSAKAYTVRQADHWAFADTGLGNGDTFGQGESILGYETDAAQFVEVNGVPKPTGSDGTPTSFEIIATCDLSDWGPCGQAGRATMGSYRNNGAVFTAATIGWADGFAFPASATHPITRNVLNHLRFQLT
jgi:hypothetical protein